MKMSFASGSQEQQAFAWYKQPSSATPVADLVDRQGAMTNDIPEYATFFEVGGYGKTLAPSIQQ